MNFTETNMADTAGLWSANSHELAGLVYSLRQV